MCTRLTGAESLNISIRNGQAESLNISIRNRQALPQRLDVPSRVVGFRQFHTPNSMAASTRGRVVVPMQPPEPENWLRWDGERMVTDNP